MSDQVSIDAPSAPSDHAAGATGRLTVGYAAIAVAVAIWAAWIVWTRQAVSADYDGALTPIDLGLLRFGVPALVFAPIWIAAGLKPKGVSWLTLLALLGWGAPFVLLASEGMKTVAVAHVGALVPGVMPLWAALFAWAALGERLSADRGLGLALILGAVAAVVGPALMSGRGAELAGAPWLIAAAASWALFAIAVKRAGLRPMHASGLVSIYSLVALAPLALLNGSKLPDLALLELGRQALLQGVLAGAASIAAYAVAIDRLGAARAASFSALVPVLAALLGWAMLGEPLAAWDWIAIALASIGVALVNGVAARRAR